MRIDSMFILKLDLPRGEQGRKHEAGLTVLINRETPSIPSYITALSACQNCADMRRWTSPSGQQACAANNKETHLQQKNKLHRA
jgi:hypothetical protein